MSTPQSRWNARNPTVIKAANDRWRENPENKSKIQESQKRYRLENPDRARDWWAANGKSKQYHVRWRAENRYKARIVSQNRRKAVREGKVSFDIIDRLLEKQDYECAHSLWWCKADFLFERFHVDHIMPLALGGKHEDNNLQLLCTACNLSKGSKRPDDFILQEMRRRIKLRGEK